MRKLDPKTQANYIRIMLRFTDFPGRAPNTATVEDLRRYQLHLVDHGISPISLNAAITRPKFFYGITLEHAEFLLDGESGYSTRGFAFVVASHGLLPSA